MSQHPLLREIESSFRRTDVPELRSGDSVRVHTLIKEGDKERVQIFEGVVIGQHRGGSRASFTVRKISYGVGVERIFPLHTSRIEKIEVRVAGAGPPRAPQLPARAAGQGRPHQEREGPPPRRPPPAAAAAAAAAARAAPRPSRVLAADGRRHARSPRRAPRPRAPRGGVWPPRFLEGLGFRIVARNWRQYGPSGRARSRRRRPRAPASSSRSARGPARRTGTRSRRSRRASARASSVRRASTSAAETPSAAGYRFDVVAVTFRADGRPPELVHIAERVRGRRLSAESAPAERRAAGRSVDVLAGLRARPRSWRQAGGRLGNAALAAR